MQRLIGEATVHGNSLREQIVSHDGKKVFEMYASILPDRTCGIALIDVTAAIAEERRRKRREWEIYRDILGVVTAGKLLLLSDEELFFLLREGHKSLAMDIQAPEDLALLRRSFKRTLEPLGFVAKRFCTFSSPSTRRLRTRSSTAAEERSRSISPTIKICAGWSSTTRARAFCSKICRGRRCSKDSRRAIRWERAFTSCCNTVTGFI